MDIIAYDWITHPYIPLKYFTTWAWVLMLASPWIYRHVNVLFIALVVFASSFYIVHINPQYLNVITSKKEYQLAGVQKIIIDVLIHWIPLIVAYVAYAGYYQKHAYGIATVNAVLVILLYIGCFDPRAIYKMKDDITGLMAAGIVGIGIYVAIIKRKTRKL